MPSLPTSPGYSVTMRVGAPAGVRLSDTGAPVTRELVSRVLDKEVEKLQGEVTADQFERHYRPAADLVRHLCLDEDFVDFLTLPAYELVT